jgi:hypothetical protein
MKRDLIQRYRCGSLRSWSGGRRLGSLGARARESVSKADVGHVGQKARAGTHAAIGTGRVPLADWHLSVGRRVDCGAIATLSKF